MNFYIDNPQLECVFFSNLLRRGKDSSVGNQKRIQLLEVPQFSFIRRTDYCVMECFQRVLERFEHRDLNGK